MSNFEEKLLYVSKLKNSVYVIRKYNLQVTMYKYLLCPSNRGLSF
jgi:hypothetical protein